MSTPPSAAIPDFLYGTAWKEERTAALTELAIRSGFRGIDTANQRKHYFEEGVGTGLAAAYGQGIVTRADLFLQTKFTYQAGQDHRLPYDPEAPFSEQVQQSLASSLEHLDTNHVDSFVLHGPISGYGWIEADAEVWASMLQQRDAGRARMVGISNVSLTHLQELLATGAELPAMVQNRCYARRGWDRAVREFCREHNIRYQGFSLLTANAEVFRDASLNQIAQRLGATPPQIIFAFARSIGMLPLTGTTDPQHMQQDLASSFLVLSEEEIKHIEALAG